MNREKPRLYRKVNTTAYGVRHRFGGDYKDARKARRETFQQVKGTMFGTKQRGLDYTPLAKFLLSKVGCIWDEVFSETVSRLDKQEPIFWFVALHDDKKNDIVALGESTYFSGLFVDDEGILQLVNPDLKAVDMKPSCNCCPHTFNGKIFGTE